MTLRAVLCTCLLAAAACGGAVGAAPPTAPPTADPPVGMAIPDGPVLFEPEQLIFPPEEFPVSGAAVARDTPVAAHGWERQLATPSSADFRWFTIRLFVLDPDVPSTRFIQENGCGSVSWPGERPIADDLHVPAGETASACRYTFADGQRVLYYATGFRNVGIVVGTQPKREQMTDAIATEWLAALAKQQVAIVGRVLIQYPPPR